jgi:hypothetical protein
VAGAPQVPLLGPGNPRTHARITPVAQQVPADYFPTLLHSDPQKSSIKLSSRHVLFAPPFSRKRSTEAKTPRNSLSWTILQGTSLFSRFYSETLPVNSRKQGICLQNMGGGARCWMCSPVCTLRYRGPQRPGSPRSGLCFLGW